MASALLKSTPFDAPRPLPTIIAIGVARPREHGQAITKTATNISNIKSISLPAMNHIIDAINAIAKTVGTKILAILSAILCIGAFEFCVS